MLLGDVVGCPCLHQAGVRGFHVAARNGAFFQQRVACIENILRDVEVRLGLSKVELRLLQVLHHSRLRSDVIGGVGLLHGAAAVAHGCIQIGILECGKKLPLLDMRSALDQECLYRRRNLGHDGCLGQGQ
jgi:hypothetical protein